MLPLATWEKTDCILMTLCIVRDEQRIIDESTHPIGSMGLRYIPAFGLFFKLNASKNTIHGFYGNYK